MHETTEGLSFAPTDLGNFLGCRHLSVLDLGAARGSAKPPVRYSPMLEDLREKGIEHERAYLDWLRGQGLAIVDAEGRDVQETIAAMRAGVDVIYQATLSDDRWEGHADFLQKAPRPSHLGDWSYEVYDTKLARETRAGTILQLCVYSLLLETFQGIRPAEMHVVTPGRDFEPLSYRVDDYGSYFRLLAGQMVTFLANPATTYPERVPHCDYCAWWLDCEKRRRGDDHLCYVAGISRGQIESLRAIGINRLADLAVLDPVPPPSRGSQSALVHVRDQARVQQRGRDTGKPFHEFRVPFDAEHGFALLPEPAEGDVFLDFEGDHFAEGGVQEYLLGYVTVDAGQMQYTPLWAETPEQERRNFETFIDLVIDLRRRDPGAHVYHFAPYEPAALKRLMGRYATREVELDELLRGKAFVDLHQVVKRSLIASVERYSIKDLEPFFGYERAQDLREASQSMRLVESAVADGSLDADDPHSVIVEDYNREDCESTLRLRNWLEMLRAEVVSEGHAIPRPPPESGEASEAVNALDQELQGLREQLLEGMPDDPGDRTDEEQARFALAHMMEFHRREDKANWWEFFRLHGLEEGDLLDERRAVSGLVLDGTVEPKRAPVQRYRFPAQDLDVRRGDYVHVLNGDRLGQIASVDYSRHMIDIKKQVKTADEHPAGIVLHSHVPTDSLRNALKDLGKAVLAKGFVPGDPYRAAINLLLRRPPGIGTAPQEGEDATRTASRIARVLNGEVLAIQGPPGTGKTYAGGGIICALVEKGLKVGVTAVSHKVIVNLLESASERARERGLAMRIVDRDSGEYEGDLGIERIRDYPKIRKELEDDRIDLLGATAWCWTRPEFQQSVDVLVVDEAGQMSLANVLGAARAGQSLVLLGDPQQLEQPLQSSHPEGSEVSALSHLLEGAETMPADRGLFLGETYRLHPDIARFTSEVYYQGKVQARPGLDRQRIVPRRGQASPFAGAGLRYVPVIHSGNQARSPEEVDVIARLIDDLIANCDWRNQDGKTSALREEDVLVVAPYNAQVSALAEAIPRLADRIGTVDRFQGQEAPVVIYSMTSSSADDAPRGMEFLYNRFRFNVATSRARALCILVGCPELFRPECRTPAQMRMANGFCRYRELAEVVDYP